MTKIVKMNKITKKQNLNNKIVFNENITNIFYLHYKKIVCLDIIYKQNITNFFNINKIQKIALNTMDKNNIIHKKYIIYNMCYLINFAMQKGKYTTAHKSIANFKLRKNNIVAIKKSLRKMKMYFFLQKLIYLLLPKIKSFNKINVNNIKICNNINISLHVTYNLNELENYFEYFSNTKNITISLITNIKSTKINLKKKSSFNYLQINNNYTNLINNKKLLMFFSSFKMPVKL